MESKPPRVVSTPSTSDESDRPGRLLVDELDQVLDVVDRCLRDDAVTEVEDVTRLSVHLVEDRPRLSFDRRAIRTEHDRIEIALNRLAAKRAPRRGERRTPIERDHVAASLVHLMHEVRVAGAEMDDRHTPLHAIDQSLRIRCDVLTVIV